MQAIEILKLQFEHIGGLVDTLIFSSDPSRPIELNLKQRNVFILHTPNLAHWVVITNINHNDEGKWLFLDSLNHISYLKSLRNLIIQICTNNTSSKNRIEVYSVNMAQQIGTYDCGLFAIAYAFELCIDKNPANLEFDQSTMRAHYNACLANRRFTSFKQTTRDTVLDYQLHRFNKGT